MPDNILGKVGEKVGAEIKTVKDSVTAVANDLANINVNSITGDLSVTGGVGASTATITGKITAGSLEVQGETKVVNTQTVEVSDNILELNKASDGTVTATTSGISINRGSSSGVGGSLHVTNSADDGSNGFSPSFTVNSNLTWEMSEYDNISRTEVTDLQAYMVSVGGSFAGDADDGKLLFEKSGGNTASGTVKDGKYYVHETEISSPHPNADHCWAVAVWWRDANGNDHDWYMTVFISHNNINGGIWYEHEWSGQYTFDGLILTNDGTQDIGSGMGFYWVQSSAGNTQVWHPIGISFTAGTSSSANDKAEFLWNNTDATFETNLGSALTRVKTDGIDVPDGDGVKINTVSIGTYADFESELNTALA